MPKGPRSDPLTLSAMPSASCRSLRGRSKKTCRPLSRFQTETVPTLDARCICSHNVPIGGEPLSTGSVFDIVYQIIANAGEKPAPVDIDARPRRQAT